MANPIIKGVNATWGTGDLDVFDICNGIVTRASRKKGGADDVIYDENGFTVSKVYFDNQDELSIDLIFGEDTEEPERGGELLFNGCVFLVDETELMWEQRGWKKMRVKATFYTNLTP